MFAGLVADFRRDYHVDLLGPQPRLPWGTFTLLTRGLLHGGAFWGAVGDMRAREAARPLDGVDGERYLLAQLGRRI